MPKKNFQRDDRQKDIFKKVTESFQSEQKNHFQRGKRQTKSKQLKPKIIFKAIRAKNYLQSDKSEKSFSQR